MAAKLTKRVYTYKFRAGGSTAEAVTKARIERENSISQMKREESYAQAQLRMPSEKGTRALGVVPQEISVHPTTNPPESIPIVPKTLSPRPSNLKPMTGRQIQLPGQVTGLQAPQITNPYNRMGVGDVSPFNGWPIVYRGTPEEGRGEAPLGKISLPGVNPRAPWTEEDLTPSLWKNVRGALNPKVREGVEKKYGMSKFLDRPVTPEGEANAKFAAGSGIYSRLTQGSGVTERLEYNKPANAPYVKNRKEGGTISSTLEEKNSPILVKKNKKGNWIKGAVDPKHKGYCTPMTKSTCTPKRKAFAKTMKKHHGFHKDDGGTMPMSKNGSKLLIPRTK